jgi:RNA polymerase sigma-70 factor (ECF subfamily)
VTVLEDEEIVRVVLGGHVEAYSILVDRYKNLIFDLCYKYTYDYSESQDLSQEIFIKVFRKLYTYNGSSSFSTWLYRVGTNTCIDWTRKNKKSKDMVSIDEDECMDRLPSQNPPPEDMVVDSERKEIVRNAVQELPEKYRTVIILYNFKGLSCSEIAEILGDPVKTIETRLYRAKKMLRESLLKPCHGGEYVWNAVK